VLVWPLIRRENTAKITPRSIKIMLPPRRWPTSACHRRLAPGGVEDGIRFARHGKGKRMLIRAQRADRQACVSLDEGSESCLKHAQIQRELADGQELLRESVVSATSISQARGRSARRIIQPSKYVGVAPRGPGFKRPFQSPASMRRPAIWKSEGLEQKKNILHAYSIRLELYGTPKAAWHCRAGGDFLHRASAIPLTRLSCPADC
jgi:hypothetical protein